MTVELGLDGKVFVVTGGSQGVGGAIAEALADAGAAGIVIAGRDAAKGAATRARLEARGAEARFVAGDLAEVRTCRQIVAEADRAFGRVDGLVNAAGSTARGTLDDTTEALWDELFHVNVRAPFFLSQEAVRLMRRDGIEGTIVNIATMSSHGGQPKLAGYAAAKGALVVLTRNLAHALRHERIRVNAINIGWTETPNEHAVQRAEGQPENWLEAAEAAQPFGRLVKPADVAHLCLYLLGPLSGVMTGAVIDHDQMVMGAYD
ncbi:MAG: SDR family oxidoreductase [Alphaproteobacteria bacterium]|nr:SDR family oxidoreductase [Alphaproteobacteria bacterium]